MQGNTDQEATLASYLFALQEFSVEAIKNTIGKLCLGQLADAHKRYSPAAPELATYVREEQNRLDAINRPKSVSYQPVSRPWKDWKIIQRATARELEAKGFVCVATGITHDMACARARQKRDPAGSVWFWCIEEIWSPNTQEVMP